MSSWPIRITSRPIYVYSDGPNDKGALSGEMIQIPAKSNVRVVEQVKMDERFGQRFLSKTTGKFQSGIDGTMKQWWGYIGKDDLEVYKPEPAPIAPVSVSALV